MRTKERSNGVDLNSVRELPAPIDERRWSARQRELFDHCEALFLDEGFKQLTIGDLADRLHCSRRTLYTLAPSREELILIVIDRLLKRVDATARSLAEACDDPADAIAAYLEAGVNSLRGARPAFNEDVETYMPTKQLYDRHLRAALDVISGLVATGIENGAFRSFHPALVAEIFDAAVERIRRPDVLARAGVSIDQAVEELGSLLRGGLVQPAGQPEPARKPNKSRAAR
jgi:AcrR family transcriptional regulator